MLQELYKTLDRWIPALRCLQAGLETCASERDLALYLHGSVDRSIEKMFSVKKKHELMNIHELII